ncbi:MAG: hypothetical protein VYA34_05470 [Myxococcota bacterium]|nr:hypothetical protein [Myxococcota bacterium]
MANTTPKFKATLHRDESRKKWHLKHLKHLKLRKSGFMGLPFDTLTL